MFCILQVSTDIRIENDPFTCSKAFMYKGSSVKPNLQIGSLFIEGLPHLPVDILKEITIVHIT